MSTIPEQIWRLQREWSARANILKATYSKWQSVILALAISAAVLSTLSTQITAGESDLAARILAMCGAVALGLVAWVGQWKTTPERLRGWIQARSVSEELKALVYAYLAGCDESADQDTREQTLWKQAMGLVEAASSLATEEAVADQKPLPEVRDVASYVQVRIDSDRPRGQIQYYRDTAAKSHRLVRRKRNLSSGLAGIAAIVGALGALGEFMSPVTAWIAVVTTAVAAYAAHVAAGRHEFLAISYKATENRLRRLQGEWTLDPDRDPCSFVQQCETAISSQNEGWMAEFMKRPDKAPK